MVGLAATAKVTGVNAEELALNFKDVGFSIEAVGDSMLDVAKIANQAGVTVASVAGAVSKNLEKLNLFNFDNGVKGLAKMAAQASRLGVDMEKIFTKSEELLDPEKAIDFAASLQRLGVTSSELLDPLRAMDLAQNDPVELQNQIANLSKDFVRFNEQNNQFEILPGAKRRMREVADAVGMSASEFSKMAINAASFDEKLKKIKFSPDVSDDDRELVATMAQFSKEGVAQVKVKTFDETGKLTGQEEMVDVSKLTAEQITSLKTEQALQNESMEKIAIDQLSEMTKTNAILNERLAAYQYGMAQTSPGIKDVYSGTLGGIRDVVKDLPSDPTNYINAITEIEKKVSEVLSKMGINYGEITEELGGYIETMNDWFKDASSTVVDLYESVVGTTSTASATPSSVASSSAASISSASVGGGGTTPAAKAEPSSVNITHTFNFSNLPNYVTSTEVENLLKQYVMNPITASAIVTSAGNKNAGLTTT